jgi:hypothetical protein
MLSFEVLGRSEIDETADLNGVAITLRSPY